MWFGYVLACGVLGLVLGWEASSYRDDPRFGKSQSEVVRYLMLALLGASIAAQVATAKSFFVVYLSALGSYYLLKPIGKLLQRAYWSFRDTSPHITLVPDGQMPFPCSICFDLMKMPGIAVETILFRDDYNNTVRIEEASLDGHKLELSNNGWLEPVDLRVARNGYARISIALSDWSNVANYRVIGRWDNGLYWEVDRKIAH